MMSEQSYGCTGQCNRGERDCPHPDACLMPVKEGDTAMQFLTAVALAAAAIGVGFFLAWLIP